MNRATLLVTPSSPKSPSLGVALTQQLLEEGVLSEENFFVPVDGVPAWARWVQKNDDAPAASDWLVEKFGERIAWAAPLSTEHTKVALDVIFNHCSPQALHQVLAFVPASDKSTLDNSPTISLVAALSARRVGVEHAKILLNNGWDLEGKDELGRTPLLRAPSWSVAQQLLEFGANVLAVDSAKTTIWDRVRDWSSHSTPTNKIVRVLKEHMNKTPNGSTDKDSAKRQAAIDGMFQIIGEQKVGALKQRWTALTAQGKPSGVELVDTAGRTFARALCDKMLSYIATHDSRHKAFFLRMCNHLLHQDGPNNWIDLSKPLGGDGLEQWTDRDHLMMTISLLSLAPGTLFEVVEEDALKAFAQWQDERLPDLAREVAVWVQQHAKPKSDYQESALRTGLAYVNSPPDSLAKGVREGLMYAPPNSPTVAWITAPMRTPLDKVQEGQWDKTMPTTSAVWAKKWSKTWGSQPDVEKMLDMWFLNKFTQWGIQNHRAFLTPQPPPTPP